jgi:GT2 family glycosyltransferase
VSDAVPDTLPHTVRIGGEAAEVARAETQAVLAMAQDETRRGRLADVLAALEEGQLPAPEASALAELLELGLQSGRIRSLYGPEGEQATLALYRRLPAGRELVESASNLTEALGALSGRTIERLTVSAVGPGEYGVTISTNEVELVLRLGRAGARLATIGA